MIAAAVLATFGIAAAQQRGKSGLPLPRFVSLKSDPVNLRTGPGRKYPRTWVYRRAGLPVEIIQEHENWRRVRDAEGASGWIPRALLSSRRTVLVLPWEVKKKKGALIDLEAGHALKFPHSGATGGGCTGQRQVVQREMVPRQHR